MDANAEFREVFMHKFTRLFRHTRQYPRRRFNQINPDFLIEKDLKMMASEDMALFLQRIPGALFFVGAGPKDVEKRHALHHPSFDIDESGLINAAALLVETCQQLATPAE